jgi:hypothetical protein
MRPRRIFRDRMCWFKVQRIKPRKSNVHSVIFHIRHPGHDKWFDSLGIDTI